jgi:hypothetical protein
MGKLKDFLTAEGRKLLEQAEVETRAMTQWFDSVKRLLETIKEWIRAADPQGIIRLSQPLVPELGNVRMQPGLELLVGATHVDIVAASRGVAGLYNVPGVELPMKCSGMVEMRWALDTRRFLLFRIDGCDSWHVRAGGMNVRPLTSDLFEDLLTDALR